MPDQISLTTLHLHIGRVDTDIVAATGTGFIYKFNSQFYLVTNWHVVSGKNPTTDEVKCIPTVIVAGFRLKGAPGSYHYEKIPLYDNFDSNNKPLWLEHPTHRKSVDVVAIRLSDELATKYELFPINEIDFDQNIEVNVADDAFVIGYPFKDTPYLQLPIWKRASIASEPTVNLDQLPKLLIDATTRPGMSGSPVVVQRIGIHGLKDGQLTAESIFGRVRWFLGVYSGRIGVDDLNAQLGIVWKAKVVHEILEAQTTGET